MRFLANIPLTYLSIWFIFSTIANSHPEPEEEESWTRMGLSDDASSLDGIDCSHVEQLLDDSAMDVMIDLSKKDECISRPPTEYIDPFKGIPEMNYVVWMNQDPYDLTTDESGVGKIRIFLVMALCIRVCIGNI